MSTLEYHLMSTLESSGKGDIQLVAADGKLYVRRYREISQELFQRIRGVSCPYLERLVEQSRDENGAYFVSEYVEGTPASECTFSEKEAVKLLLELCAAIRALHKAGVIHRDIKPSNIICGNDGHIRLIDFDSARLRVEFQSRDTEILGTGGYAAPEQYGFMQTDDRSDIYAFGVTMDEILGENADKPKFRRIIRRCTQFDPDKRYRDISAVGRAIKRAVMPDFLPFAAAGGIAAVIVLAVYFLRGNSQPAPPGIVRLTEISEAEVTLEIESTPETDNTSEAPETETPTGELPGIETAEPIITETAEPAIPETAEPVIAETSEPVAEYFTAEAPQTEPPVQTTAEPEITEPPAVVVTPEASEPDEQVTAEIVPETSEADEQFTAETAPETSEQEAYSEPTETFEPEAPAIQTPEMPFTTTVDDDGLYRDDFDYVFYDDPAVHGMWRAYKVLPGDADIGSITGDDIFHADNKSGQLSEFITVYPNGTLAFYQPIPESIEPTNLWTNGYYISSPENGGLVCRMRAFTVSNGKEFLALEQRPTRVSDDESAHRFIVYFKVVSDD